METPQLVPIAVSQTKQWRKDLDAVLQAIKLGSDKGYTGVKPPNYFVRTSRERSLAITKVQEAIMWLGMDLKDQNEGTNPYPESYKPESAKIEPTADGLKL